MKLTLLERIVLNEAAPVIGFVLALVLGAGLYVLLADSLTAAAGVLGMIVATFVIPVLPLMVLMHVGNNVEAGYRRRKIFGF